jgi:hypothetical protein
VFGDKLEKLDIAQIPHLDIKPHIHGHQRLAPAAIQECHGWRPRAPHLAHTILLAKAIRSPTGTPSDDK